VLHSINRCEGCVNDRKTATPDCARTRLLPLNYSTDFARTIWAKSGGSALYDMNCKFDDIQPVRNGLDVFVLKRRIVRFSCHRNLRLPLMREVDFRFSEKTEGEINYRLHRHYLMWRLPLRFFCTGKKSPPLARGGKGYGWHIVFKTKTWKPLGTASMSSTRDIICSVQKHRKSAAGTSGGGFSFYKGRQQLASGTAGRLPALPTQKVRIPPKLFGRDSSPKCGSKWPLRLAA